MRRVGALFAIASVLAGCALTRTGQLREIPDGHAIPVTVRVSEDSALVTGRDPATGETFRGTLTAVPPTREKGRPPEGPIGGSGGLTPSRPATTAPREVTLEGVLDGDRGTSLTCRLTVQKSIPLRGSGSCTRGAAVPPVEYTLSF